ncbi:MAG: glycosyltransferase family 2 protein [Gemmatimonadaceae bacterium]|nr:glycosyltransferase family 2 protein [Gemmatimonadaceae bacterium]
MTAEPLVSVIVPAFNAAKWIAGTLASVTRQTWKNIETIVVDDGSTDDTVRLVEAGDDPRIRVIRQSSGGAAAARNRGTREATGELIQYLDADDLLGPDKISLQVSALGAHPPETIASGEWGRFAASPELTVFRAEPVWTVTDPVQWLVTSLSGGGMMQPAAWLTPRSVVESAGAWNEQLTLHDDGEFFARVLLRARRNVFVPGARVYYRDVEDSLSRRRSRKAIESALAVCRSRHLHLIAARDDQAVRRALATQYAQFAYEHRAAAPDLAQEAVAEIAGLGVEPHSTAGGKAFRLLASVVGFSNAVRIRSWS